jgi:Glycosyl transferases group 1
MRPTVRIRRKLCPRPYADRVPAEVVESVVSVAERTGAEFVFLNLVDLAPIARSLKEKLAKQVKIVLLSHGLESVDYLHAIRVRNGSTAVANTNKFERDTLARQLISECSQRQFIDRVFCLAPFEVEIERWLGARDVSWLPRTIPSNPLKWSPVPSRVGFVGALDHPPNAEGLKLFASALSEVAQRQAILRVVGGPAQYGAELSRAFPIIEYLGPLSKDELEQEASTWSCFVNPIFCYARGCSTKLAVGLGWGIPVVTTPAGCRGYCWREGTLAIADTPEAVAKLAIRMLDPEYRLQAQREILRIVESAPSLMDVAAKAREALLEPKANSEYVSCLNFN